METTQNNDIIIALIVTILFIALLCFLMILVVVNFVRRKRKILLEEQERKAAFDQQLLQSQIEIRDATLKNISQEIHDNVGQVLSLAKLNLSILSLQSNNDDKVVIIKELVSKAISDLRDLSTGYYADRLAENGLFQSIKHEIYQLEKTGLFAIHFSSEIKDKTVDKHKAIFVYRMVQEVLNNIVKHADATNIWVKLFLKTEWMHIYIEDDGKGFDTNATDFKYGIGLSSIETRAAMIEAKLNIQSELGKGTKIELVFS
jgi:signal transduction histidine kinase